MSETQPTCGALNKRGFPCTRVVSHPDERCWQHLGRASIRDGRATSPNSVATADVFTGYQCPHCGGMVRVPIDLH